jgi:three-Cys-motif partner protein
MQKFGGDWTEQKIDIVVKYTKAYLEIMKSRPWELLYFDGFAGSGEIAKETENKIIPGSTTRILQINNPISFDIYYFVEFDKKKAENLKVSIKSNFPEKKTFVVQDDCNRKLKDLAFFLKGKGKNTKVLAFIDPFGMELRWESLEYLKGLGLDLWILIPTGLGANRLLKRNGEISDAWFKKLEYFLGINRTEIIELFYKEPDQLNLFGEKQLQKEEDAINKLHKLYRAKLNNIFNFVSNAFVLKNQTNSIMFHFLMATNNATALKIANDVIKKYKL